MDAGLTRLEGWRGRLLDDRRNRTAEPHIPGQTLDEFQVSGRNKRERESERCYAIMIKGEIR